MLSRRLAARASALRPASRLPIVQQRSFMPAYTEKLDEKYPDSDYPRLTDAEDPNMVRCFRRLTIEGGREKER